MSNSPSTIVFGSGHEYIALPLQYLRLYVFLSGSTSPIFLKCSSTRSFSWSCIWKRLSESSAEKILAI